MPFCRFPPSTGYVVRPFPAGGVGGGLIHSHGQDDVTTGKPGDNARYHTRDNECERPPGGLEHGHFSFSLPGPRRDRGTVLCGRPVADRSRFSDNTNTTGNPGPGSIISNACQTNVKAYILAMTLGLK